MGNHPNRAKINNWPDHLRAFRGSHGLTQAQLADHLMVSRRLVENWEGGINEPPAYLKLSLRDLSARLNPLG